MLIKNVVLAQIEAGAIDTLFRRQKRPTVKTGGTLRTGIGMLDIVRIDRIDLDEITERDAARGGFESVDDVVNALTQKPEGDFYRIRVRLSGEDPRITLRNDTRLNAGDLDEVSSRLGGLDARSTRGPWTYRFLAAIADEPNVRASDLAESISWETRPFKENVRKLKALGLTISHSPGYELSPRGRVVFEHLTEHHSAD